MPQECSRPTLRERPRVQLALCSPVFLLLRIQPHAVRVSPSEQAAMPSPSLGGDQPFVGGEGQEVLELVCQRYFREDLRRCLVAGAELLEFLALELEDALAGDAIVPDPLPDLRAADL